MPEGSITVKQLNLYVKSLLEGDSNLSFVSVIGEISNFKNHYASGHWYFTLKDSDAAINCMMFKSSAARVGFVPSNGDLVLIKGRVSLFEKDGQYQLYADSVKLAGDGDISANFTLVKEKLQKEGLFDSDTKRKLPSMPKKVAVITSDSGAAVKDITNILARRFPLCEVVLCPVNVQGLSAANMMIKTLERVYSLSDIDLIIIGRGGGSQEDLSAFNDEMLARKIYESPVPVISAVGHETDFTICDFVADVRASTPSAAAELAVPDIYEVFAKIKRCEKTLNTALNMCYQLSLAKFKNAHDILLKKSAFEFLNDKEKMIDDFTARCNAAINSIVNGNESGLKNNILKLDALNPTNVLQRGVTIATKDGKIIQTVDSITQGDKILILFNDGFAECKVLKTDKKVSKHNA